MFDLSGKTALVTGASGGIGRAIAQALHAQGAKVAISGTRQNVLEEVNNQLGGDLSIVPANLTKLEEQDNLISSAEETLGQIDILVNNAGITRDNLFLRMKDGEWDDVIAVNLTATFRLSRAVLKGMMRRRWGRIISITSVVGVTGNPGQGNYAASKAGMIGMTKSLAQEIASRNVTVNCVAPGFIATAMTDELGDENLEKAKQTIPAGRVGEPSDVAAGVVYLSSDEANYVTGQTLHINGGLAMV